MFLKFASTYYALLALIVFIISGSFLGTQNTYEGAIKLPSFLNLFGQAIYFICIAYFSTTGLIALRHSGYIKKEFILIFIAYFILLIWSCVTRSDVLRYLILSISVLFVPIAISKLLIKFDISLFTTWLVKILYLFIFLNSFLSIVNMSTYPRFFGIYSNPNLMGMVLFSQLCIFLYFSKHLINKRHFLIIPPILFLLIIMTGSRLSTFISLLVLCVYFTQIKGKYTLLIIVLTIIGLLYYYTFILGDTSLDLNYRAFEFSSSVSDSGRSVIWDRAYTCIRESYLVGHGMRGSEECVLSGNVHNSYLRLLVMTGVPIGILFYTLIYTFIFRTLMRPVNIYIKVYFFSIIFLYSAEDYVVGVGSPFFCFFLVMLGILLYDGNTSKFKILNK